MSHSSPILVIGSGCLRSSLTHAVAFLFCVVCASDAHSQKGSPLRITSQVNASKVQIGDSFQLDITVRTNGQLTVEELAVPDMRGFNIIKTHRGQQSSIQIIGGQRTVMVEYTYTYLLQPIQTGRLTIGEVTARAGKHTARAPPIRIQVANANGSVPKRGAHSSPAPGQQSSTPGKVSSSGSNSTVSPRLTSASDPIFRNKETGEVEPFVLDMRFEKDAVFVGEQVNLVTRVYSTSNVEIPGLPQPKLEGFWVEPLENSDRGATQRILGGTRYYVYVVQTLAVFPLEAGLRTVEPRELQIQTRSGFWSRGKKYSVQSQPATLNVLELPKEEQPVLFPNTNVGEWSISARVSSRQTRVGDPVTLQVTVRGKGNLQQVVMPSFPLEVDNARVFPPTFSQKKYVQSGMLQGSKTAEMLVQPLKPGRLTIPSVEIPTFNPRTKRYEVKKTRRLSLRVDSEKGASETGSQSASAIGQGARPIHTNIHAAGARFVPQRHPWFVGGLLVSGCLTFLLWGAGLWRRARRRTDTYQNEQLNRKKKEALRQAVASKDIVQVRAALMGLLAEHYGAEIHAMASDELQTFLFNSGMAREDVDALGALWAAIDQARYAPMADGDFQGLCDQAEQIMGRVGRPN